MLVRREVDRKSGADETTMSGANETRVLYKTSRISHLQGRPSGIVSVSDELFVKRTLLKAPL